MAAFARRFGPHAPKDTYVPHAHDEEVVDLGEVELNHVTVGDPASPALLLIPGQTESWWGYEAALPLLAEHFQAHAVDLRGQGRSTRTPGRYTLDLIGGDLVRFIDEVIGRPTIVAKLSSGGVAAAWLSAYAKPGQVLGAGGEGPPQQLKEYDPEWGRAFWEGTFYGSCDHERMLRSVKVPVLFSHHFRVIDEATGALMGASSDLQASRVRQLVEAAGQSFTYVDLPAQPHPLHGADAQLYVDTLVDWAKELVPGGMS